MATRTDDEIYEQISALIGTDEQALRNRENGLLSGDTWVYEIMMPRAQQMCPASTVIHSEGTHYGFGVWAGTTVQTEGDSRGKAMCLLVLELELLKAANPHRGMPTPESQVELHKDNPPIDE